MQVCPLSTRKYCLLNSIKFVEQIVSQLCICAGLDLKMFLQRQSIVCSSPK